MRECFISLVDIDLFNPCTDFHESEKLSKKMIPFPGEGMKRLNALIQTCECFKRTVFIFRTFCNLLECDLKIKDFKTAISSIASDFSSSFSNEKLAEIFNESFIIKKRTARYVLNPEKKWEKPAKDSPPLNLEEICRENISDTLKGKFTE